jgi:hypothetical protein
MADFLTRLARRAIGTEPTVRPVLAPLFAPGPDLPAVGADDPLIAIEEQVQDALAQMSSPRRSSNRAGPLSGPAGEPASTMPAPHPPPDAPVTPAVAPIEPAAAGSPPSAFRPTVPPPTPLPGDQQAAAPPVGQSTPVAVPHVADASPERAEVIVTRAAEASADPPSMLESLPRSVQPSGPPGDAITASVGRRETPPARPVESAMAAAPPPAEAAPPSPTMPPTIRVSIGRIDVRAVQAPVPAPRRAVPPAPAAPSLEEYLRARGGGRR